MTRLILVRHGESVANYEKIFAGHFDADLQERGVLQAQKTAEYIAENYNVDRVYASDLIRAFRTGKCIADLVGAEIVPNKNLREIFAGEWDGKKFDDIRRIFAHDYEVWLSEIGRAKPTGGETVAELAERVNNELLKIATENDGKTVVVATHATPIRAMQSLVQTGGLGRMKDIPWVSNASVSVLDYDGGKWRFELICQDSHLGDLNTGLPKNV